MNHLSEAQIVLHCYGDAEDGAGVDRHLAECAECRARFQHVQQLLRQIEPIEVPEPPAIFEEKTWLRLRDHLPEKRFGFRQWIFAPVGRWAFSAAAVLLIAAAFLAGRFWPRNPVENAKNTPLANPQRVVLVAVGDHLERSQMLLVEIMNADPGTLGDEQKEARDLLDSNHLYQASAMQTGDPQVAGLLDELGRVLTEIANSPSQMSPGDLQQIRGRIQSDGLLFKVRVVGSDVNSRLRRQEQAPAANSQRL
ncbi:MAG TPA: hypothetical protein VKW06_03585 [Candidatus Angelobacter sp.]|nr:hypothetical protein [Candidatus Angelobacter sp.]